MSDVPGTVIDAERGRRAARLLHEAFAARGNHGRTEMSEDVDHDVRSHPRSVARPPGSARFARSLALHSG